MGRDPRANSLKNMANTDNLKPIKKGERLAAKPKHLHRSRALAIRLTEAEFGNLGERAAAAGLSLSKYGRRALGFDK